MLNKKNVITAGTIILILVVLVFYFTHRSVKKELTESDIELKNILSSVESSSENDEKTKSTEVEEKQEEGIIEEVIEAIEEEKEEPKIIETKEIIKEVLIEEKAPIKSPEVVEDTSYPDKKEQIIDSPIPKIEKIEPVKKEVEKKPEVKILKKGSFNPDAKGSDSFHRGWGSIQITNFKGSNKLILGEDFKVTNGPDFYIYLTAEAGVETQGKFNAAKKIRLTRIKQFSGYQVYDIPSNIDIEKYKGAVIWCDQFGVFISTANLK